MATIKRGTNGSDNLLAAAMRRVVSEAADGTDATGEDLKVRLAQQGEDVAADIRNALKGS